MFSGDTTNKHWSSYFCWREFGEHKWVCSQLAESSSETLTSASFCKELCWRLKAFMTLCVTGKMYYCRVREIYTGLKGFHLSAAEVFILGGSLSARREIPEERCGGRRERKRAPSAGWYSCTNTQLLIQCDFPSQIQTKKETKVRCSSVASKDDDITDYQE